MEQLRIEASGVKCFRFSHHLAQCIFEVFAAVKIIFHLRFSSFLFTLALSGSFVNEFYGEPVAGFCIAKLYLFIVGAQFLHACDDEKKLIDDGMHGQYFTINAAFVKHRSLYAVRCVTFTNVAKGCRLLLRNVHVPIGVAPSYREKTSPVKNAFSD